MAVYFARQGLLGPIKIGSATDVVKRIKSLQTGQPVKLRLMKLFDGDADDERALHRRFSAQRISGEWFTYHPSMDADIGLPEIERPRFSSKRYQTANDWPNDPIWYERILHEELTAAIGGKDNLARRSGVRPWRVSDRHWCVIHVNFWGAAIMLAAERGRHEFTYQALSDAAKAANELRNKQSVDRLHMEDVKQEADWIKYHADAVPWWELYKENQPKPDSSVISLVPKSEEKAA